MSISGSGFTFDETRMISWMHKSDAFDSVLHVAHREWHGIRHATAYLPGHKLLISSSKNPSDEEVEHVASFVDNRSIKRVVFQGYSDAADYLAVHLAPRVGREVQFYVITHTTTSQFDNNFEMHMQARIFSRLQYKTLTRIGSVKPYFSSSFSQYYPHTIINLAPTIPEGSFSRTRLDGSVFIPLDVGWRKNRYTNIIAALKSTRVSSVLTNNFPDGIESLIDLSKLKLTNYLRGLKLFEKMATVDAVLLATLAECQPMTQLEAFAVGTPALTLRLNIPDFQDDEVMQICGVDCVDNGYHITKALDRLLDWQNSDPAACQQAISDHLTRRQQIACDRYADFLEL
jgi:hypothetical protein